MQSTLITGNRGFIGSGLKGDGFDVKNSPFANQDICHYEAEKKYDVVIHTAAKTSVVDSMEWPELYFETNVRGTFNMVRQHPEAHFVYLSTAGIYGEGVDHTVESAPKPTSVYTLTKYLGEWVIRSFAKSWCILRLTNVIGEGERGEPNVYQVFKREKKLPIYGDGLQTRDFIRVEKVREVIMQAINKRGIYNIGSGVSKTVLEVAKEFDKPMKFLPAREGEIRNFGVKDAIDNLA